LGFRDGCDDCDGIFDTGPCCHFNRHNRHQSSHDLSRQADGAAVPGALDRIINLILVPQFSSFDVELACQNVWLYIHLKQAYQLRCAAVPLRIIRGNHGGDLVQQRIRWTFPKLRFRMVKQPDEPFRISDQVQPLVRLIPANDVQCGAQIVRFSFCRRNAPSAQPSNPLVPEIISNLSPASCFLV
jgi:hypothetical protein